MRKILLLSLFACVAFGDPTFKNAGTRLGPVGIVDCSADGGVSCTRTAATGTVNMRCSSASATELGCVSTSAQTLAGTKAFTGGVRTTNLGGVDGGVYAKLSDDSSLIAHGAWGVFQPYGAVPVGGSSSGSVLGIMGALNGLSPGQGLQSSITVAGVYGSAVTNGLNIDGGSVSTDGGSKGFWLNLLAIDDAGTRVLCTEFKVCEGGIGPFHPVSLNDCGMDGGGRVNRGGNVFLTATYVNVDGSAMLPDCATPAVNYTVNYTGLP